MKPSTLHLSLLTALLLLTGCTSSHFLAYVGEQREWQTQPGSLAETVDGMTVFHDYPNRPYDILGSLSLDAPPLGNLLRKAVAESRAHGGDALIVSKTGSYVSGVHSTGGGSFNPWGWSSRSRSRTEHHATATCLVIRLK